MPIVGALNILLFCKSSQPTSTFIVSRLVRCVSWPLSKNDSAGLLCEIKVCMWTAYCLCYYTGSDWHIAQQNIYLYLSLYHYLSIYVSVLYAKCSNSWAVLDEVYHQAAILQNIKNVTLSYREGIFAVWQLSGSAVVFHTTRKLVGYENTSNERYVDIKADSFTIFEIIRDFFCTLCVHAIAKCVQSTDSMISL